MADMKYSKQLSREQMMRWIMCLGFCADDMKLYLDTHSEDMEALAYYNQCKEVLKNAKNNYVAKYGPLTLECEGRVERWNWNNTPMPWEGVN